VEVNATVEEAEHAGVWSRGGATTFHDGARQGAKGGGIEDGMEAATAVALETGRYAGQGSVGLGSRCLKGRHAPCSCSSGYEASRRSAARGRGIGTRKLGLLP
jgi:hypothetical protein